ncbi:hypothetical protein AOLI_G00258540 [Acnodon oligacanthus]
MPYSRSHHPICNNLKLEAGNRVAAGHFALLSEGERCEGLVENWRLRNLPRVASEDQGGGASSCTNSSARACESERTLLFCLAPISSVTVRCPAIQTSPSICPSTTDGLLPRHTHVLKPTSPHLEHSL